MFKLSHNLSFWEDQHGNKTEAVSWLQLTLFGKPFIFSKRIKEI